MRSRLRAEKSRRLAQQEILRGQLEEHQVSHVALGHIEAPVQDLGESTRREQSTAPREGIVDAAG
ncbi:hypothetical protein [Roseomonas gilardii]|uniref:hypothetical protein n=1 Tax=Roseomonas gilardii TaxID=257708 RepID=UPI0011AAC5DC|nr:hypothetical protein [Roseomonas gilardii]